MRLKHLLSSPRIPRTLLYPAAGLLLAVATPAGLLGLRSWLEHRVPTPAWIIEALARDPTIYGYLFGATLLMTVTLGWILGRKEDLLEQMSVTDPLTGLANRRRLRAQFAEELNRSARYGTPLAVLLIDLDRLKDINDQLGHAAGDRALQAIADSLRQSCRATDVPARYGGDEFIVLAVNTTATEALALAHRIRANVRRLQPFGKPSALRLSVSIGASDVERADAPEFEAVHAAADEALYRAKSEGRDRAVIAPPRFRGGAKLKLTANEAPDANRVS